MDKTEREAEMFFGLEERDQLLKASSASIENLGLSDYLTAVAEADEWGRWRVYWQRINPARDTAPA